MQHKQLFHVIWTTFDEYPVWDKQGNWQEISDTYLVLQEQKIAFHLSRALPSNYSNKESKPTRLVLNEKAITQLKSDIEALCEQNKDRIIDGLAIKMLHIDTSKVEMLVFTNSLRITQQISRLKSRTSTLLSLKYPEAHFGKGTWGKGFWQATLLNKEDLAITIINNRS